MKPACDACGLNFLYEGPAGATFSREVMVEIWGVYDGALFYECPNCGHRRHRWSRDVHPEMWAKAERWVNAGGEAEPDPEGTSEEDPEREEEGDAARVLVEGPGAEA